MDALDCTYLNVSNSIDRCAFVTDSCAGSGLVNLWYINYCLLNESLPLTIALAVVVSLICFNLLQTTAEMYLTPLLKKLADDLKLPQTVAGVTLLAFANGAPDIISAFAAGASSEGSYISIGSLVGASIFGMTIIVAKCVTATPRKRIRVQKFSWNRDLIFYVVAIMLLAIYGFIGQINLYMVLGF